MITDRGAHNLAKSEGSEHQYPRSALLSDLLCGFSGLLVCTALIAIAPTAGWLVSVLAVLALLFGVYLCRVLRRCRYRMEMNANSLRVFATPNSDIACICLEWNELERLELDYFCTRRDGRGGWLQLRLRAGARTVRLDSRLLGFERVLARAVEAARTCGVALSATTANNLLATGFDDGFEHGSDHARSDGAADGIVDGLDGKPRRSVRNEMNIGVPDNTR